MRLRRHLPIPSFIRRSLPVAVMLLFASPLLAQVGSRLSSDTNPAPPTNVRASDAPNDHGHAITVTWELSLDDGRGQKNILAYKILRSPGMKGPFAVDSAGPKHPDVRLFASAVYGAAAWRFVPGEWDTIGQAPSGQSSYANTGGKFRDGDDFLPDNSDFQYRVVAVTAMGAHSASDPSAPARSSGQIFHVDKILHIGLPVATFTILVLMFISIAKSGRALYIRPLAGISAVDEAIGRATEMNRPILYVLGLGAADDIATIASLTILSRVAKKVAEHRTELLVPCYDGVVMTIAQETVRQSYLDAGRPEDYKQDIVYFVTQEQFAYVAAVSGTMLRRQTATNLYLGMFFAESLILAETGSVAGSIQIAGTDQVTQIPFFVVACDYALIGEELYAASAYLGREPKLLGALKAQDWAKAAFITALVIGVAGAALRWDSIVAMFRMNLR